MSSTARPDPVALEWLEILPDSSPHGRARTTSTPTPTTAGAAFAHAVLERRPSGLIRVDRVLTAWIGSDRRPPGRGTDLTIRRILFVPFDSASALLETVLTDLRAEAGAPAADAVVSAQGGRLEIDVIAPATAPIEDRAMAERRRPGRVQVHRFAPAIAVDLVLAPWSTWQTELRLQPRGWRAPRRLPRHYFDVAHPALSALRDRLEQRGPMPR